ncbi:MAG: hypothetical protein IT383_28455 [Deltaproteobacteria bacterium]|nr:hypothetical protein [Deltaproteobacteria bacterium]
MRWVLALVGVAAGLALGLFGPVLVLAALELGSGSYEDVLFLWMVTLPGGAALGGWGGYRLGAAHARRHPGANAEG